MLIWVDNKVFVFVDLQSFTDTFLSLIDSGTMVNFKKNQVN